MNERERMSLDMAIYSMQADLLRLEQSKDKLNESDCAELRIIMARINSVVNAKRIAA